MWSLRRAERELRRFKVKKVVPPRTRLRRWLVVGWKGVWGRLGVAMGF